MLSKGPRWEEVSGSLQMANLEVKKLNTFWPYYRRRTEKTGKLMGYTGNVLDFT